VEVTNEIHKYKFLLKILKIKNGGKTFEEESSIKFKAARKK
jgi:hypothetical protein